MPRKTDKQLSEAWQGPSDQGAFAELDRRHRGRIGQHAIEMGFSDEDADDIVQETLLGLVLTRGMFDGDSADAHIACIAAASASASKRGGLRRSRLRAAVVCDAVTARSSRESAGRPDAALLTAELADIASIAVRRLPGWCRPPFMLRAVKGQSARISGAALNMIPATVNMWVAHARRLLALDMNPHLT